MKYINLALCLLFSITVFGQSEHVYQKTKSDSLMHIFLTKNMQMKSYSNRTLKNSCVVININYINLEEDINLSNTRIFKPKFDINSSLPIAVIIDTLDNEILFSINKDSNSTYLGYLPVLDKNFRKNFSYLKKHYNLEQVSIFILPTMPDEFYISVDNVFYIVYKKRIYNFKEYILKKYKSEDAFIKKYKRSLSVY